MQTPEIWGNQKKASELGARIRDIKDNLEFIDHCVNTLEDSVTALEIGDSDLINECFENLN